MFVRKKSSRVRESYVDKTCQIPWHLASGPVVTNCLIFPLPDTLIVSRFFEEAKRTRKLS